MRDARDIDEVLAIQMALGDDRAVRATYVAGRSVYDRDGSPLATSSSSSSNTKNTKEG
jgi:guanine deaminase